ncbi:MAG: hypothetical protein IPL49_11445 [Saprospirales bacterium]|nr:hypothetical protein [Saprospirales bacterium]
MDEIATTLAAIGTKTNTHKGYTATEESFKAINRTGSSPRILHLATHGYFFPDPKNRDEELRMGDDEPVFKMSDHPDDPLRPYPRRGYYAWQTGKPIQPGMEDGILTAHDQPDGLVEY